jgi:Protein of unknown function (DUF2802)
MNDILIMVVVFCAIILMVVLEFVRISRAKRIINEQITAIHRMQNDMHALCAGAINMGKHVDALERKMRRLTERQDQLELRDPMEQTYAHAIRLAQKGADVNELVENCGLARGEAELLLRIHRVQRHQTATA